MTNNKEENFLIEEYRQCWTTLRHYDTGFWKIPSIAITIVTIFFGVLFMNIDKIPEEVKFITIIFILSILLLFLFALLTDLYKMRFYQKKWFNACKAIENEILTENSKIELRIANYGESERKENWYNKISVVWFYYAVISMLIFSSIILSLFLICD